MESKYFIDIYLLCVAMHFLVSFNQAKTDDFKEIEQINDMKTFKKLLRTKTNILIVFSKTDQKGTEFISLLGTVAGQIKGQGTLAYINCGNSDGKKLCKKLKCDPDPLIFKHYKDGEFNKDYDRKITVQSMVSFMKDPTGDIPWEEESSLKDILHIPDAPTLEKLLKKENKGILIMFYAPWCGFCKRLKPQYAEAASELRGHSILAAMDVNKPSNAIVRQHFNITGFPTLLYFEKGAFKFKYEGENGKEEIVQFMHNPAPIEKPKEEDWSTIESDVVHLTDENFDAYIATKPSVLIMFYAPWCGHCKAMKPEYVTAAEKLSREEHVGVLAAVDATKETGIAGRFSIRGFPTVKYFELGEFKYDVNFRTADKIIQFMKDPQEPPPPPPPEKPWSETESDVVHLDESNFKSFLKRKKHVIVMFYAPWCGHCKKAKPEFSSAATHFREDSRIAFVAVDCTVNTALCVSQGVEGYPTIKYFSFFKTVKPYEGARTMAGFLSFMNTPLKDESVSEPGDVHQITAANFESYIQSQPETLVLFYRSPCSTCEELKSSFNTAAISLRNLKVPAKLALVDVTHEKALLTKYNIDKFPSVKYFRKGIFESDFAGHRSEEIIDFVKSTQLTKDEL